MKYIEEIKEILPHRYPFLLVDRILSVVPGESIIGIKNVTANEEFFNGHFPDKPVMPGVLMVEAMAQVAGVLFLSQPENKGKVPFFCGIDKVRFRRPVVPGDRIEFKIKVLKVRRNTGKVEAEARVDGELVTGGELMFQLV
jgi:3-hydroxyacyl-[acyl-carrier-protein] dehydratase